MRVSKLNPKLNQKLDKVILYDEGIPRVLNIAEIAEYLREKLTTVEVELRESPFCSVADRLSDYAQRIASLKIQDATKPMLSGQGPLYGEIEYEKRRISGKTKAFGVLYEGLALQRIFRELIPREERSLNLVHIVFTNRLLATWEAADRRYHARTSLYGLPSIISTTGIVEAPAKPREYYLRKQQCEIIGKDPQELKESFRGRFIDYDDERLTEVVKGYAMQAVFYSLIGNPFCQDRGCRLYNAHWQEELVFAQLESQYEFCPRHAGLLESEER